MNNVWANTIQSRRVAVIVEAGIAEKHLRDMCRDAGFERGSHFLMFVRWLAYEILIDVEHVRPREALAFIGIRDSTNLARQTEPVREWLQRRKAV